MIPVRRLSRILRMGPAELGSRGRSGARRLVDGAWLAVAPPPPHEAGLARRLARPAPGAVWETDALAEARRQARAGQVARAGEALRAHLLARPGPPLPGRPDDRPGRLAAMLAADPTLEGRLVATAESLCAGRYDLLGYRGLDFGRGPEGGPDWHLDPVSGRRAPRVAWGRVPYLDAAVVGDHKVTWELSRHQHWLVLALAHAVTGRARYVERLALEAASWLAANPPKVGIHWASMLECAFRTLSWLRALPFALEAPALSGELLARLVASLDRQLRHVHAHLSRYFSPNTHLLGESLALLVAGVRLPELAAARAWREVGLGELARGAEGQVLADGLHAERSTAYHRYATDFYLEAVAALEQGVGPAPASARERQRIGGALRRLLDALAALTLPDGSLPALGDEDGGEALPLDGRGPLDARPALAAGAAWLADRDPERAAALRAAAGVAAPAARAVLLFGPRAAAVVARPVTPAPPAARLLPHGGYAVIRRGRGRDADLAVIDVGPLGDDGRAGGSAGHAHADALSLFIVHAGVPRVIDPGTFTYAVPEWREAMRATSAHATLAFGGRSSSEPGGPFRWTAYARVTRHLCRLDGPVAVVDASHDGYRRLDPPLDHRRVVVHGAGPGWWVLDLALPAGGAPAAGGGVLVEATWPAGLGAGEGPPAVVPGGFAWGEGVSRVALLHAAGEPGASPLDPRRLVGGGPGPGWVSPRYGARHEGAALRFSGHVGLPASWWWWIGPAWLAATARLVPRRVEPAPGAAGRPLAAACELAWAGERVVVAWAAADRPAARVAGLSDLLEGRLTVVRVDATGTVLAREVVA